MAASSDRRLGERIISDPRRIECHLQNFGKMKRVTPGSLPDLLAATESVGDDEPVRGRFTHCGQKFEFADGRGDFIFVVLKAERAGHPTASRSWSLEVDADSPQQRLLGSHLHDGLVMAVSVQQCLALVAREWTIPGVAVEKLAEQKCLPGQGLGTSVVRKKVQQFIAKNGNAAGLKSNDRDSRFDFRRERVENLEQQRLCSVEHAKVVERAAATQIRLRKNHLVSSGLQNFDPGFGGCRQKIVVEGVGPEKNRRTLGG